MKIGDVTEIIDAVLSGSNDSKYDVNNDGEVNINDVTYAIDAALNQDQDEPTPDDGVYTVNGVTFRMVNVEGGTFTMGAANTEIGSSTHEKPQHEVTLDAFSICETQVTQELWTAVMGECHSVNHGDKKPMENVSWNECQTFISKLNELTGKTFRLPTEAEWEFAARGGNESHNYLFAGGNSVKNDNIAWYSSNSNGTTHDVATKNPNELGLYDMSGNVNEWVNDWYVPYNSAAQTNPVGPAAGTFKIYRGGDYKQSAANCRVHFRYMRGVNEKFDYVGFRLAL